MGQSSSHRIQQLLLHIVADDNTDASRDGSPQPRNFKSSTCCIFFSIIEIIEVGCRKIGQSRKEPRGAVKMSISPPTRNKQNRRHCLLMNKQIFLPLPHCSLHSGDWEAKYSLLQAPLQMETATGPNSGQRDLSKNLLGHLGRL